MSIPSAYARYHSKVSLSASLTQNLGDHQRSSFDFVLSRRRSHASCMVSSFWILYSPFQSIFIAHFTISSTLAASLTSGPKLYAQRYLSSWKIFSPIIRYPESGSRTCCHGRTESGFLNVTASHFSNARIISGIRRSTDQSPPPITFPARTDTIFFSHFEKKERTYEVMASSSIAFEVLYGSCPQRRSVSRYGRIVSRFS